MEEEVEQEDFQPSPGPCTDTLHISATALCYPEKLSLEIFPAWHLKASSQMAERLFLQAYQHIFSPPAHFRVAVAASVGPISGYLSYLGQPTQRDGRLPWGYHLRLDDNALLGIFFSLACHCSGVGHWAEGLGLGRDTSLLGSLGKATAWISPSQPLLHPR